MNSSRHHPVCLVFAPGLLDAVRDPTIRQDVEVHSIMPDANADELHTVLAAGDADVLIVGHTHVAMDLRLGERLVVNPGALLREPADGWEGQLPTPGTFGLLELPEKRWTVIRARTGRAADIIRARR